MAICLALFLGLCNILILNSRTKAIFELMGLLSPKHIDISSYQLRFKIECYLGYGD
jgi:hypothetical protein